MLVADAAGEKLLAATFAHDEHGVRSLCRQLVRLGVELVAIERPDGLLVERLLDAGLRVLALHPNQVAAARDRFRVSGGKSDRFDAFVLCELARTDNHRFRVLEPDSDATKALRALTRGREDLVGARTALCNQLRAELERFWPGPLGLFSDLHSQISLTFLSDTPAPPTRAGSARRAWPGFSRASTTPAASSLPSCWRSSGALPTVAVGELELSTRRQLVLTLVSMIKSLGAQIKELERQLARTLGEHPDGEIFRSLFRDPRSVICAAELLAEIGDCRGRYPSRDSLAADAGQAAVAIESGKRKAACFRWGCNSAYGPRSPHWPTAPATGTPGPKTSTPPLSPAGTTTPARCGPSGARGAGSCGSAGRSAPRMTPRATARCNSTSTTLPLRTRSGDLTGRAGVAATGGGAGGGWGVTALTRAARPRA